MIQLKNVSKKYNKSKTNQQVVINSLSLDLPKTGLITILGRSGSGKTTLLKLISGLLTPSSGEIYYQGLNINKLTKAEKDALRYNDFSFIFQDFNLIDNLTVFENINITFDKPLVDKSMEILENLNLSNKIDSLVSELSTGEKQRVSIARTLIRGVNVIYADEPTGSLDEDNAKIILDKLEELSKHILVILVTHNKEEAYRYSDRIFRITKGNIEEEYVGKPDISPVSLESIHYIYKDNKDPLPKKVPHAKRILNKRKLRFIFSGIFWYISFSIFLIAVNLVTTNKYDFSSRMLNENNKIEFKVTERDYYIDETNIKTINTEPLLKYDISLSDYYYSDSFKIVNIEGAILQNDFIINQFFGDSFFDYIVIKENFEINGKKTDLLDNEIIISDFLARKLMYSKILEDSQYDKLQGKKLVYHNIEPLEIKYIYSTDYIKYFDLLMENRDYSQINDRSFNIKRSNEYSTIYMNKKTFLNLNNPEKDLFTTKINNINTNITNESFLDDIEENQYVGSFPNSINELFVSLPFLSIVLGEEITNVSPDNLREYLNKSYTINIGYDDDVFSREFLLTGISYSQDVSISLMNSTYNLLSSKFNDLKIDDSIFIQGTYITMNTYKDSKKIIKYLLENNSFYYTNFSHDVIYGVELIETQTKTYLMLLIGIFIFTLLTIYYFTTTLVNDNINEIGILRSFGYSEFKMIKMLSNQNIKIFTYTIILSLITLFFSNYNLNKFVIKNSNLEFDLFKLNTIPLSIAVIFLGLIIVGLSILPIVKITKKELAEVIYY